MVATVDQNNQQAIHKITIIPALVIDDFVFREESFEIESYPLLSLIHI